MWNTKIMSGTGAAVVEKLNGWERRIEADELMILDLGHSPQAIYRSTELIVDAYGLPQTVIGRCGSAPQRRGERQQSKWPPMPSALAGHLHGTACHCLAGQVLRRGHRLGIPKSQGGHHRSMHLRGWHPDAAEL
jgi:hypothetical protein